MVLNLRLFQKTSELENKVDSFFLKLAEAGVIYRLAVRNYLREGLSKEYKTHFEKVCDIETSADTLRSEIKLAIYSDMLIPDSRGDVLGLLETADEVFSLMKTSLWAFSIEAPTIDEELVPGYRRLTNMVAKAVDELATGARVFFQSPHLVSSYVAKVNLYEKEADKLSTNLKKQIFSSKRELALKLHLREFVDRIDSIADHVEDVADRLTIYAIKRQS